jgi:hypothetical protein
MGRVALLLKLVLHAVREHVRLSAHLFLKNESTEYGQYPAVTYIFET